MLQYVRVVTPRYQRLYAPSGRYLPILSPLPIGVAILPYRYDYARIETLLAARWRRILETMACGASQLRTAEGVAHHRCIIDLARDFATHRQRNTYQHDYKPAIADQISASSCTKRTECCRAA
jgi:hypothetical protein